MNEKKNEKCVGNKWELNGTVNFSPKEARKFYNKILILALNVKITIEEEKETYLQAVYGNGNFHLLLDPNNLILNDMGQNIKIFMNKFRGILYDFRRELIWSFKCK